MSMRAAINAKCRDCIYDPLAGGTWRAQTEACVDETCGLWPYRPRRTKRAEDSAELAEKTEPEAEEEA